MPQPPSQPGVYVEEVGSAVRAIAAASTSTTAFVGRAWRGPVDRPVQVFNDLDYERSFGGSWPQAPMTQAVTQFFRNGGTSAWIVRVATRDGDGRATQARIDLGGGLVLLAASPGTWGRNLTATVTTSDDDPADPTRFDLVLREDPALRRDAGGMGGRGMTEHFRGLSLDPGSPRYCVAVLSASSVLVRVLQAPPALPLTQGASSWSATADAASGHDGLPVGPAEITEPANEAHGTGLYALGEEHAFNLLCLPPFAPGTTDNGAATWRAAAAFCRKRRAFLLIDAPAHATTDEVIAYPQALDPIDGEWAAIYHPWLRPRAGVVGEAFAPGGSVAGCIARMDSRHGVWRAPAGLEAVVLAPFPLATAARAGAGTTDELSRLTAAGICTLREDPAAANVMVWGARTLAGAGGSTSDWKYIPVRRTAAWIEESLYRSTTWAVFEANDERLWSRLRLAVGDFLHQLFRAGAFAGGSTHEAYFVRCGADTHTAADLEQGRVNLEVGFACLRPAEFVVLRVRQGALPAVTG